MSTTLEKSILATVAYYDILDYPLTGFEIFLYLVKSDNVDIAETRQCLVSTDALLSEIIDLLNSSEYLKKHISQELGFYFLKGRNRWLHSPEGLWSQNAKHKLHSPKGTMEPAIIDIVQQRLERKKIADQKWNKIKPVFKILQIVPFIKFMMVSGSLAMGNTKKESDIDLIIVAKKGRIWTARTLITLLTSVLGVRRHGNITQDKICLNHYITDQSLKIPFESLYNAQSYCHLISIYDNPKFHQNFQKANQWITKYVHQYPDVILGNRRSVKRNKFYGFAARIFEKILSGKIGDLFEKYLGKWQTARIKSVETRFITCPQKNGRITIDENQLEFHPNSHEARIIPEFNRRMEKLELPEFAKQKDSGLGS